MVSPSEREIRIKCFGWWFAWGGFSTIMLLIVIMGGGLSFSQMVGVILLVSVLSGLSGLAYYVKTH